MAKSYSASNGGSIFPMDQSQVSICSKDHSQVSIFSMDQSQESIFLIGQTEAWIFPISVQLHSNLLHVSAATVLGYLPTTKHLSILSFLLRIISSKLWLIRSNSNIIPEWGDIFLLNLVIRERIQPFRKLIYLTARERRRGWSSVRSIVKVFEWLGSMHFSLFPLVIGYCYFPETCALELMGLCFLLA